MKFKVNILALSLCLMLSCTLTYGQKTPPTPNKGPSSPVGVLPIDGGLVYLLITGVAYGVYTVRRKK